IQQTVPIDVNTYLQIHPIAANAGPITSGPTPTAGVYSLSSIVQLSARPRLVLGAAPSPDQTSLPNLGTAVSGENGFRLNFDARVTYDEANARLASQFPITETVGAHSLILCNPVLSGTGSKVMLEADLYSIVRDVAPRLGVLGFIRY